MTPRSRRIRAADRAGFRPAPALTALALASALTHAAPQLEYDAALGTLPDAQGWLRVGDPTPQTVAEVTGGVLFQSTMPTEPTPCQICRLLSWSLPAQPISYEPGLAFEIDIRIINAPIVFSASNVPRPGFAVDLIDSAGAAFRIGFTEDTVYVTRDLLIPYTDAGVAKLPIDTTETSRLYRLELDGYDARLLVDGAERLTLAGPGPNPLGADLVRVGDFTGWSNSAAEIRRFSIGPLDNCPADLAPPAGLLDLGDISAFVSGFVGSDPVSDLDSNGVLDLADINIFVTSFLAGCP